MTDLISIWYVDVSSPEGVPYFKVTPMCKRMLLSSTFSMNPQSIPKWHDIFDLYFAGTCN